MRRRFGYRRLHLLLQREGMGVNHKKPSHLMDLLWASFAAAVRGDACRIPSRNVSQIKSRPSRAWLRFAAVRPSASERVSLATDAGLLAYPTSLYSQYVAFARGRNWHLRDISISRANV